MSNPTLPSLRGKVQTVRSLLERMKPQLAMALPRHLTPDRLLRVCMTSIQRNPKLLECTEASLVAAVMTAAQLGLEPDGQLGHAYLIPYPNRRKGTVECQLQPGYLGLLELARNSGQISGVEARVVRAKDEFRYVFGLTPVLVHIPSTAEDRGDVTYIYSIVRMKDGAQQWDVMSRGEIEAHRKKYSRDTREDSAWVTAWDEMGKKTVLRRVLKLCPASIEAKRAIALDEHAEADLPQDLDPVLDAVTGEPVAEPEPPPSQASLDRLAAEIGKVAETEKGAGASPVEDAGRSPVDRPEPSTAAPAPSSSPEPPEAERAAIVALIAAARTRLGDPVVADVLKAHGVRIADLGKGDPAVLGALEAQLRALMAKKEPR